MSINRIFTKVDAGSLFLAPVIHGILVQLPLPASLESGPVLRAIRPEKDVDGVHPMNAGALASGDLDGGLQPCTPAGAMRLVREVHGDDLSGLVAVVVGRTRDLAAVCRLADVLVVAVGRAATSRRRI